MKKTAIWILCIVLLVGGAAGAYHFLGNASSEGQEQLELGVRYLQDSRYEDALVMFSDAIQMDPNSGMAYFHRAEAYLAMAENCQDPEMKVNYLEAAEKDFIQAEILDSSLTSDAESKLEELDKIRSEAALVAPVPTIAEETEPEETTQPTETTAETTEATIPSEPTVPQNKNNTSNSSDRNSSSSYQPETDDSHNSSSSHNPDPTPEVDSTPTDDPVIDNGEPPAEENTPSHNPSETPDDSTEGDVPEIDLGEPEIVPVPDDSEEGTPEHSPKPEPEPVPDESEGGTPEHNPKPEPEDASTPVDKPSIDFGEPPEITFPDDTVDLGSPDTSSDDHSEQVAPSD